MQEPKLCKNQNMVNKGIYVIGHSGHKETGTTPQAQRVTHPYCAVHKRDYHTTLNSLYSEGQVALPRQSCDHQVNLAAGQQNDKRQPGNHKQRSSQEPFVQTNPFKLTGTLESTAPGVFIQHKVLASAAWSESQVQGQTVEHLGSCA